MPQTTNDTDGNVGKPRLLRQDKWKQQSATTTKENWEKEKGQIFNDMAKHRRKHMQADRLYRDKCKAQEHGMNGTEQHTLAWKHATEPSTQSTNNATLLHRTKIQKTNTSRDRQAAQI